ncbi:MAG: shikimate dehydrogenase [Propionibacteriaceae bacterium]|jgi:shikimate dehydrogenase|nr:shikimate dehydrogenase [Propionibacteriaceae bacterium]
MRCAVLGSPIAHSLSPLLHTAGYRALGLDDWEYTSHEVGEEELAGFLDGLGPEWRGLSLTMPLKRRALELASQATATARGVGVANTLVRLDGGGWLADNTDVGGLADALRGAWLGYRRATILGAGATATSALFALGDLGVEGVIVYARNLGKAAGLAAVGESLGIRVELRDLAAWADTATPVLLSVLPAGVITENAAGGGPPQASSLPLSSPPVELAFDVVYWDWPTPFARAARSAGATVVSGMDMLVYQAVRQFELFTGRQVPAQAMFDSVAAQGYPALRNRPDARHVVLTGFMGAGKTTVGEALAQSLQLPFIDIDAVIERRHGRIADIFAAAGEAAFRAIEADTVLEALAGPRAVVALGGGSVETAAVREALAAQEVIWLRLTLDDTLARLGDDPSRPVLRSPDRAERFARRQPFYRASATKVIDVGALSPEEVVAACRLALAR